MSAYTVRVELRGDPSYSEYEKLHGLMSTLGYSRTVAGINGTSDLPHATYFGHAQSSVEDVRTQVLNSVKARIQNRVIVFVAKTETWALGW